MYWYSTTKALRQDWVIRTAKELRKKGISKNRSLIQDSLKIK